MIDNLGGQAAVLLTPAHQFPLGVVLGPRRRSQVVQWARDSGALVIEDDYDGEFRYDRHPVGALQALAPEHVIYAGTVSKTLAPGLRLGWLVLPAHLMEEVTALLADTTVSTLGQLALAELITSGGYDRHVRRQRLAYRHRRDHLIAAVQQIPGVQVTGVAAGLHLILRLPSSSATPHQPPTHSGRPPPPSPPPSPHGRPRPATTSPPPGHDTTRPRAVAVRGSRYGRVPGQMPTGRACSGGGPISLT